MIISSNNLFLRACEIEDFEVFKEIYLDSGIRDLLYNNYYIDLDSTNISWCESVLACKSLTQLTIVTNSNEAIGFLHISQIDWKNGSAQIDISIKPSQQRRGYGKEALIETAKFIFKHMRFETVVVYCLHYNVGAKALLKVAGFSKDAVLNSRVIKNGERHAIELYSLLPSDLKDCISDNRRHIK